MRRLDCHGRIKAVRSRYHAARRALTVTIRLAEQQPGLLFENELDIGDLKMAANELEEIYFTRMFAAFESSLRDYWTARVRATRPLTEVLLNSVAARHSVPREKLDEVHEIRRFRNCPIHEELEFAETRRFTIDDASGPLNEFLARLPLNW